MFISTRKLLIILAIAVIFLPAAVYAVEVPTTTPSWKDFDFDTARKTREALLNLFGIPLDTPVTITDILEPGAIPEELYKKLSPAKKANLGPLSDLVVKSTPSYPKPLDKVRLSLITYTANLSRAQITWLVDGKKVKSGVSEKTLDIEAGEIGSSIKVEVRVTAKGKSKSVVKIIRPARIRFTWVADTYTPAWYKGKAMPTSRSVVTITAIPEFRSGNKRLSEKKLIYDWLINDRAASSNEVVSGQGRQSYTFKLPLHNGITDKISVRAMDTNGNFVHQESIYLNISSPMVNFYEKHPLYGTLYEHALVNPIINSGDAVTGKAVTFKFTAEPFFLPINEFNNPKYEWSVDKRVLNESDSTDRVFKFIIEPGSLSRQTVSVVLTTPESVFGRLEKNITFQIEP